MQKKENTEADTGTYKATRAYEQENKRANRRLLVEIIFILAGLPVGLLITWLI